MDLERIRKSCKKCGGTGVIPTDTPEGVLLVDCECLTKIKRQCQFNKANIPRQYWEFGIEDINEKFRKRNKKQMAQVQKFIKSLESNIARGKSLWFCSTPGLGKSTIVCSILKKAMEHDLRAYFTRASRIVTWKFSASRDMSIYKLLDDITYNVDVLAIEEIDKVYLSDDDAMNNQLFYEFLSDMYDSKKTLLISSNRPKNAVLKKYPSFIMDRYVNIPSISFFGASERAVQRNG